MNVSTHSDPGCETEQAARRHTAITLWFTGLSASGKSTIACGLEQRLSLAGRAVVVLDGDQLRRGLNSNLGFSAADRRENIRRTAEVAKILNEAGLTVIAALISPACEDRAMAREIIGPNAFREIYISTPLATCEQRDPKGLYARARANELPDFTGISSPYEPPASPDLRLNTSRMSVEDCVLQIDSLLKRDAGLPPS